MCIYFSAACVDMRLVHWHIMHLELCCCNDLTAITIYQNATSQWDQ